MSTLPLNSDIYFVPDPDLILKNKPIPYHLYINASASLGKEKFIKIFPKGDLFTQQDHDTLKEKYKQLYISEAERGEYLKSICSLDGKTISEKGSVLKKSAIHHLNKVFEIKGELSVDIINRTLDGTRQTVEGFVELVKDYDLSKLHELIGSLSFHDFYTYDHSINVSMYNILIYRMMVPDASPGEIAQAGMGGFLHDIGKLKISNRIINKVGKLSDEEFKEISNHPAYGYEFLNQPGIITPPGTKLSVIQNIVYQHHENFDGTGYPNKIPGDQIEFLARVTAVSDFFDAITTKRSYAEALPVEEALTLMAKTRAKKLDPKVFDFFVQTMQAKYTQRPCDIVLSPDFDPCQPHLKLKRAS